MSLNAKNVLRLHELSDSELTLLKQLVDTEVQKRKSDITLLEWGLRRE